MADEGGDDVAEEDLRTLASIERLRTDLAGHFLKEVFKLAPEHPKAAAVHARMEQLKQLKEEANNRQSWAK